MEKFSLKGGNMDKNNSKLPEGTVLSLSKHRVITLYNDKGNTVGEIDFSANKVIFEGNVNKAADRLFSLLKFIIKPFIKEG